MRHKLDSGGRKVSMNTANANSEAGYSANFHPTVNMNLHRRE
jgi:hypothetical protein